MTNKLSKTDRALRTQFTNRYTVEGKIMFLFRAMACPEAAIKEIAGDDKEIEAALKAKLAGYRHTYKDYKGA